MPLSPIAVNNLSQGMGLACIAISLTLLGHAGTVHADELEPAVRAAIILRSLGYEASLRENEGTVRIAIVSGRGDESDADAESLDDALQALQSRMEVAGRAFQVRRFSLTSQGALPDELTEWGPQVVYLSRGTHSSAGAVSEEGRVIVCASANTLGNGCILAVDASDDGARISIDLRRARRQGVVFDSRLLALAELRR